MFSPEVRKEIRTQAELGLPVFLAQIAQISIGVIDTVMTGRVGPVDMSSVALATAMWIPVVLFAQGLIQAATPVLAQLRGARASGDSTGETTGDVIRQSMLLALMLLVPLGTLFLGLSYSLEFMAVSPELADITGRYMRALIWGMPGYFLMVSLRCCMEGFARVRPAMVAGLVAVLVNVPFNYAFIFGHFGAPKLGGVGAGVASAITCWAMAGVMVFFATRMPEFRSALKVSAWTGPRWTTMRRLVGIGLPGAMALLFEVTLFDVVAVLIAPLGAIMVAGHQVALNFSSVMFMLPLSLGIAATIRVGYGLGQNSPEMVFRSTRVSLYSGVLLAATTATLTIIFREHIVLMYNNDPAVIALASVLLILAGSYQVLDAVQVISVGILRGYNDTRAIFGITFIAYWVVALPFGYTLARTDLIVTRMGPQGFWIGFVVGLSVAAIMLYSRVRVLEGRLRIL